MELQIFIASMAKLLSHTVALHSPTLRQQRQSDVLARAVAGLQVPEDAWRGACEVLQQTTRIRAAHLPVAAERGRLAVQVREHAVRQGVVKRPARRCKKRTAFTLKRVGSLVPPCRRASHDMGSGIVKKLRLRKKTKVS